MNGLVFRLDGNAIVHVPCRPRDAGPGSIIVLGAGGEDVHHVSQMIRRFVKSASHINCGDERQIVDWRDVLAAMDAGDGTFAAATVRED